MNALRDWLAAFKPARITADGRERVRACIGALIGIFTTGITSYWLIGNTPQLPMLIAPLGASAVLLFAVPSGPLAQPWPIVGGNTLSAVVGVTALLLFDDVAIAAAAGVGGAIAVMFLTRSLHPPGGAVALATVMGGDAVLQQGYYWALVPVGLESLLLLAIGLLYNNLTGRRYPPLPARPAANPHNTADVAPGRRLGFTQADLENVLDRYKQVLDVSPAELGILLKQTELEAWRRRMGAILCSDIMSRDVITARADMPLVEAWSRMHEHSIKALPVVDDMGRIEGIVTQVDLLEHAGLDGSPDVHVKLSGLLERGGVPGTGCIGDIMTSPAETAGADEHIAVLVPKLTEGGRHHIPIADSEQRLVGIVTQTDLLSALYHGETPKAESPQEDTMNTEETNTTPMTDAELIELFNTLLECERAGVKVLTEYEKDFSGNAPAVELIVASRRDEGKYCKLMFDYLRELGADVSPNTGSFAEKALAIEGKAERLAFLNRGQGWVAREVGKALPRIPYAHMREGLQEMFETHRENITATQDLIEKL